MIRDVNRDGLGDRRGVAIERLEVQRYRPGTTEHGEPLTKWRVYLDGRVRLTTDDEDEARGVAAELNGGER